MNNRVFCQEVDVLLQSMAKAKRELDIALAALNKRDAGYRNLVDLLECYGAAASALEALASVPQIELKKGSHHVDYAAAQSRFEIQKSGALNKLSAESSRITNAGEQAKRKLDDSDARRVFGFVAAEGSLSFGRCLTMFFLGMILAGIVGASGWAYFFVALSLPVSSWAAAIFFGWTIESEKLQVEKNVQLEKDRLNAGCDAEVSRLKLSWERERQQIDAALNQRLVSLQQIIEREDLLLSDQARRSQQNLQRWAMFYAGIVAKTAEDGGSPDPPKLLCLGMLSVRV